MAQPEKSIEAETDPLTAAEDRRAEQGKLFRRNQMLGLLLVAAAILTWGMLRAPKGWLFPPGWWRFW